MDMRCETWEGLFQLSWRRRAVLSRSWEERIAVNGKSSWAGRLGEFCGRKRSRLSTYQTVATAASGKGKCEEDGGR